MACQPVGSLLIAAEIFRSAKTPSDGPSKGKQTSATFTDKLVAKIVEQLQVTVRHIHIRYEDETIPLVRHASRKMASLICTF